MEHGLEEVIPVSINQSDFNVGSFFKTPRQVYSRKYPGEPCAKDYYLLLFKGLHKLKIAENYLFSKGFQVKYTPVFQFFDLAGQPTARFTGIAKGGVGEFLALGRYVVEKSYQNGSFAEYKKKHAID